MNNQDWIYVEDRTPENDQLVIVAVGNHNNVRRGAYKWRNPKNKFCDFFIPSYKYLGVFAWMPLPKPPINLDNLMMLKNQAE